jgi:hypothetical protein
VREKGGRLGFAGDSFYWRTMVMSVSVCRVLLTYPQSSFIVTNDVVNNTVTRSESCCIHCRFIVLLLYSYSEPIKNCNEDCGFESHRGHKCLSLVSVVFFGRGICVGLITRPEESCRL